MQAVRQVARRYLLGLVNSILLLAAFATTSVHAADYVYDANGRLRAVTSSSGASSTYNYDALGNLLGVNAVPSGQLAVFAFTPNHGGVGQTVTIFGQGFSSTNASNLVKFNGTVASVSASTPLALTVSVPVGATTGHISVAVGVGLATSSDDFVVTTDATGQPPTITSFSPLMADVGAAIAVTGTHFVTSAGPTFAGIDSGGTSITPTDDSHLTFLAPQHAGAGLVNVRTPYGEGQSTQPLLVIPAIVGGTANVLSATQLQIGGAAQTMSISTVNRFVAATFSGAAGQWLSMQLSHYVPVPNDGSAIRPFMTIYDPSGAILMDDYVVLNDYDPGLAKSLHLPQLPQTGVYLVLVHTNYNCCTLTFNLAMESDPFVGATPVATTLTSADQSKRVMFAESTTQLRALYLANLSLSPPDGVHVNLYDPLDNHGSPTSSYLRDVYPTGGVANLPLAPHYGIGGAILRPASGSTMSTSVSLIDDPMASINVNGSSIVQHTTSPGQAAYITFSATAGQNLDFAVSNISIAPSGATTSIRAAVADPSGHSGSELVVPVSSGGHLSLAIAQTGIYTAAVYPVGNITISYTATLTSH
jgi:YD repeat-containing protein